MRLTYLPVVISVFAASLALAPDAGAATQAVTRWVVLLNEKPVAEQYPGRVEKTRAAAAPYRQHLQSAQASLRPQIEATQARVTGGLQHLLNCMFVTATPTQAAALRKLPGVKAVTRMRTYRRADQLTMSDVSGAWAAAAIGGQTNAGAGIKIGIIDTGIDQTHPAFQDPTLTPPSGYPICDVPPPDCPTLPSQCAYTSNKVIVARSYVCEIVYSEVSNSADLAAQSRPDDLSARDLVGHGTGTASVAAGMPTTYNGSTISGVAPKAFLGNYKVFGSDDANPNGSGNVLQALEDAVTDGMDVVNLSLGSPAYYSGPLDTDTSCATATPNSPIPIPTDACDPFAYEVENAMDNALVTVVVAAGNQGADGYQFNYGCGSPPCDNFSTPSFSTMSSPAYAPSAIAVGGIQNDVTYVEQVQVAGFEAVDAMQSYDGPPLDAPLTAPLADATQTGNLCSAASPTAFSGEIVLVTAGSCGDITMVTNAQNAGAVGVIEIDNELGFYQPYGLAATKIPTFGIGQTDGANIKSYLTSNAGAKATMDPKPYQVPASDLGFLPYSVAYFASRGPVNETGALKPDLAAVATDFLMPTQNYDPYGELFNYARYGVQDGTSFATPMVTGSAALVKQANSNMTPLQIKSALVNTASLSNLTTSDGTAQASLSEVGAGLLQTQNAVVSTVQVVPSSVSFGAYGGQDFVTSQTLTLYNTSTSQVSLAMKVTQNSGYSTAVDQVLVNGASSAAVSLPAGSASNPSQTTVTVTLSGGVPAAGRFEGIITATGGPVPLTVPYMFLVGDGIPYDVIPLNAVEPGQGFTAFDGSTGAYLPWAYVGCTNTDNSCVSYSYGPVAVQVVDQYGAPVYDVPVAWAITEGGGTIDYSLNEYGVANTDSYTDANGVAGAAVFMGTAGQQEITANVNGMVLPFDGYARVSPAINAGGIVDAASFKLATVAPGSWISVFGTNLTDTTQGDSGVNSAFADCSLCNVVNQALPMGVDGASFSFDTSSQSLPGRLNYVSPTQLNIQVPWELTGTSATVKSIVNYTYSGEYALSLAAYSPGFFVIDQANDVAALDLSYHLVDSSNPVARGSYVQLFLNGLGPVSNQPGDGLAAPSSPLAKTMAAPTITIGGQTASTVQFSGLAPGFVSLYQVNVEVPAGISAGPQTITCSIGGVTSTTAQLYVK
jgi:minor extracellular serine protease Vpr